MQTVLSQLEEAKATGAKLVGGKALPGKGAYIGGGVLTGVSVDSALAHEEIFGPIAMLSRSPTSMRRSRSRTPSRLGLDRRCGLVTLPKKLASLPGSKRE